MRTNKLLSITGMRITAFRYGILLTCSIISLPASLPAQARPRRKTTVTVACLNPQLPLTPMGAAIGYTRILQRAAAAESLTTIAFADTAAPPPLTDLDTESALSRTFYNADAANREYVCAGRVLEALRAAPDSQSRHFAVETEQVFQAFSKWISDVTADFKRRMSGNSGSVMREAERLADLHRRRDDLTRLLGLNSAGLGYLLRERNSDGTYRLALTTVQRDSVTAILQEIAAGSTGDPPVVANILIKWLTDSRWTT